MAAVSLPVKRCESPGPSQFRQGEEWRGWGSGAGGDLAGSIRGPTPGPAESCGEAEGTAHRDQIQLAVLGFWARIPELQTHWDPPGTGTGTEPADLGTMHEARPMVITSLMQAALSHYKEAPPSSEPTICCPSFKSG